MTYPSIITLIDRLAHDGVRDAVICPGSRSTPLALVAEHHPDITSHVHIDERGAAFFALGIAKATGRPAMVITTSGTAVANLLPACIEAHQGNVPLLLLTADRPAELRDTGANQTMHQVGLFDAYTRYSCDAPHPGEGDHGAVAQAALRAMQAWPPGPAHINQPLREPLAPDEDAKTRLAALSARTRSPAPTVMDTVRPGIAPEVGPQLAGPRGLIVCGPGSPDVAAVMQAAQALGAVVIADALSGARFGQQALTAYDAYIDHEAVVRLAPDWILQLGHSPTSKALRTYLSKQAAPRWKIDASGRDWNDIPGNVMIFDCDASALLASWTAHAQRPEPDKVWQTAWQRLEAAARDEARQMREDEPDVEAAWVPAVLAATRRLFIGNSMPVRDLDRYGHTQAAIEVYANRGVSGIDGTIATAAGIAQTGDLLAVIGDVAFQHDVGSLALMPPSMRLVVIDNGGGHIFQHLPVRDATSHFERLFLTKPQVDIEGACAAFGKAFTTTTPEDLPEALSGDAQVIIVLADGEHSAQTRQHSRRRLHDAIPGLLAQHS